MLDRAAFGLLCRRHAFAHVPEGSALRFVLGNDGVLDETVGDDRFEKGLAPSAPRFRRYPRWRYRSARTTDASVSIDLERPAIVPGW